jgi:hypothetical protein
VRTRAGSEIALPSLEVARAEDRLGKCRQILRATYRRQTRWVAAHPRT